jgi:hypothetical protein
VRIIAGLRPGTIALLHLDQMLGGLEGRDEPPVALARDIALETAEPPLADRDVAVKARKRKPVRRPTWLFSFGSEVDVVARDSIWVDVLPHGKVEDADFAHANRSVRPRSGRRDQEYLRR